MVAILPAHIAPDAQKRRQVLTCRTCKLRKYVGRCRWETVECPPTSKMKGLR